MSSREVYNNDFYAAQVDGSISSAEVISKIVWKLVEPSSVLDIGCGLGGWLAAFKSLGVRRICGIDGHSIASSSLMIGGDEFRRMDLAKPLEINERFDLVICLEVAEHLPEARAKSFVEDLTRCSDIVLFSAAIPNQGGVHHVNEQWQSYWACLFAKRGFHPVDIVRPEVWANDNVRWWYAQNILLYVSERVLASNVEIGRLHDQRRDFPLDVVHPQKYLDEADPKRLSVRRVTREFLFVTSRRALAYLRRS
ncbi:class I SAM-dependent methyltransferase [Parvibaculum sp.]|uniref:class I SAM-dependent methyltransferase n=1 Tax=Parvibaculum sp. TaxID=2024848 RepID=UPI00391DCC49